MTKSVVNEQVSGVSVREIPLGQLYAARNNPRRTVDEAALHELAGSIREYGVQVPLLVRVIDMGETSLDEQYEIVAGHRRYGAAIIADKTTVPCIVRVMDDATAAEVAIIDNLQRVDVPAMEEAEAFGELLDRMSGIPAVAMRVGKDVAYVAKRLKLRALGNSQRDALGAGLIAIDHALLLARLGVDEQDKALKWCLDPQAGVKTTVDKVIAERFARRKRDADAENHFGHKWEPQTVLQLKGHIEQTSGRKLSRAPWPLDDAELAPEAGACSSCPSNTKANTSLFGDLDIEEATCADGACFEVKRSAFVQIALDGAKEKGRLPLRVSWRETSTEPRCDLGEPCDAPSSLNNFTRVVKRTQILKAGQWIEAKKGSCAHVEPAVTVDWSDDANRGYMGNSKKLRKSGEVIAVCATPKCEAHPKAYEHAAEHKPAHRKENSAAAAADREAWEKEAKAENAARAQLVKDVLAKVNVLAGSLLRRIVLRAFPSWMNEEDESHFPGLEKGLKTLRDDSPEFARAAACVLFVGDESDDLWCNENFPGSLTDGRKELAELLRDLGHKGALPWDKPAAPAKKAAPKKAAKKAGKPAAKKVAKKK